MASKFGISDRQVVFLRVAGMNQEVLVPCRARVVPHQTYNNRVELYLDEVNENSRHGSTEHLISTQSEATRRIALEPNTIGVISGSSGVGSSSGSGRTTRRSSSSTTSSSSSTTSNSSSSSSSSSSRCRCHLAEDGAVGALSSFWRAPSCSSCCPPCFRSPQSRCWWTWRAATRQQRHCGRRCGRAAAACE